ncbi:hypothetical protein MesoLjLc_22210 [Mesorhizobium sp. L-8-10]|uniref:hypothetical protein n=1 Tax=Mesorhizobium sp. L-8-10 TaxID=2744523 RepID=UPI00192840EC|nr:hypothetical protein [Mesorhizobium sp. L-8-10]BCH30291.1 hypothetical protein MesoLjLc_22210 [Mesorhizobium sp. L-8-10]
MLRIWLAAALLYSTSADSAESVGVYENCARVGDLARQLMSDRQRGIEQSKVMTNAPAVPALRELLRSMVEVAYAFPAYQTADMRDHAVTDFGNSLELACYEKKRKLGYE